MSRIFFLISICCLSLSCNFQSKNCQEFRTGVFSNIINGKPSGTIVKRFKDYQIEINESQNIQVRDEIVWLSDCSYKLISSDPNASTILVQITETGEDYYNYESWFESNPKEKFKYKMIKLDSD